MVELTRNRRLAAFTLFESVVAIAIISALIGIGTIIMSNLISAERPMAFYQAKEEIDRYFFDLKKEKAFFSKNYDHNTYTIEQHVDFYNGNSGLYLVEYIITTQNKQWWTEKHLVAK
jgi:hypothetical protein